MAHESHSTVARDLLWILNASEMSQIPAEPDIQRRYYLAFHRRATASNNICQGTEDYKENAGRAYTSWAAWFVNIPLCRPLLLPSANTHKYQPSIFLYFRSRKTLLACVLASASSGKSFSSRCRVAWLAARLPASFPAVGGGKSNTMSTGNEKAAKTSCTVTVLLLQRLQFPF